MGYEVTYFYHERLEDGKYNTEETKELKKNVGSVFEELPLEKLAAVIMGQLARRDIWIVDVNACEFEKKKLNFKESADGKGIILKGKKFAFNQSAELIAEDVEITEVGVPQQMIHLHQKQFPPNHLANRASNAGKPKAWMSFDPEIQQLHEARQKGLKFTVGNKYPIYNIEEHPLGLTYGQVFTTVDDAGTTMTISDKFFIPATVRLVGDNEVPGGFSPQKRDDGPRLSYEGELKMDHHDVRKQQSKPAGPPPEYKHIPIDNGEIPAEYYAVPDLGRKVK